MSKRNAQDDQWDAYTVREMRAIADENKIALPGRAKRAEVVALMIESKLEAPDKRVKATRQPATRSSVSHSARPIPIDIDDDGPAPAKRPVPIDIDDDAAGPVAGANASAADRESEDDENEEEEEEDEDEDGDEEDEDDESEEEAPLPRRASSGKVETLECLACGSSHSRSISELGLVCAQGHYICNHKAKKTRSAHSCLDNFLSNCLETAHWLSHIPIKCPLCHIEYNPIKIESLLNSEDSKVFVTACITAQVATNDNETLVTCPFCPFGAVYDKNDKPLIYFCGNSSCKKRSCGVCLLLMKNDKQAEHHLMTCGEWGGLYNEFLDLVERNSKGTCPGCGLMGVKDDKCCRMTCFRCETDWCYMCGKAAKDADKPKKSAWPIGHQQNWKNNNRRCPIWLSELHEVVEECPDDQEGCLVFFHRYRTLRALQKKVKEVGQDRVAQLIALFPGALGGYSLQEVTGFKEIPFLRHRLY